MAQKGIKYSILQKDEDVARWHKGVRRGSPITAEVSLRRLGKLCELLSTTPKGLVKSTKLNMKKFQDSLEDMVTRLESENKSLDSETTTVKTTTSTTTTEKITTSTIPEGDPDCEVFFECPEGTNFVGSKYSTKYHRCDCQDTYKIRLAIIVCFYDEEHAEREGYSPHSCV